LADIFREAKNMNKKQLTIVSAAFIWLAASFGQLILQYKTAITPGEQGSSSDLFGWMQLIVRFTASNLPVVIIAGYLFYITRNK
jgi:hypothetical protein